MNKLKVTAAVPTEIHMTRTFDAPRRLVMQAMSKPELLKRWLGNSFSPLVSADVDHRVGGNYRYVYRNAKDGREFAFVGQYREIGEDRIVHSESMEGMPGEATVMMTFVEAAGKTTLNIVMAFPSQQIRDLVLSTGMEVGAAESYDNLERLLASL